MGKLKTHEEFLNDFYNLHPNKEYTMIGKYVNSKTPIEIHCNICNNDFSAKPNNLLANNSGCPYCYENSRGKYRTVSYKKAKEMFDNVVENNEYTLLEYNGMTLDKSKIKHNTCGHEFEMKLTNFINNNQRCTNPDCIKERQWKDNPRKKTHDDFCKQVDEKYNGEYKVVGNYEGSENYVKVLHIPCNEEFEVSPQVILRGIVGCPNCRKDRISENTRKGTEKFTKELEEMYPGEYIVLGEYINNKVDIELQHIKCGTKFHVRPNTILSQKRVTGCPNCCPTTKKDIDYIRDSIYNLTNGEYELVDGQTYKNITTKMKIIHHKCNHIFKMQPTEFINCGDRCPKCKESKGEKLITGFLDSYGIYNKSQYSFKGLVGTGGGRLKFDFAILDDNKEPIFLIEYDGHAHFFPVGFGGNAEENFYKNVYHDALKNSYCEDNNIPLLRIPYWDFDNIEQILTEELSKYNLIDNQQTQSA